jgi:hypothetical protein
LLARQIAQSDERHERHDSSDRRQRRKPASPRLSMSADDIHAMEEEDEEEEAGKTKQDAKKTVVAPSIYDHAHAISLAADAHEIYYVDGNNIVQFTYVHGAENAKLRPREPMLPFTRAFQIDNANDVNTNKINSTILHVKKFRELGLDRRNDGPVVN